MIVSKDTSDTIMMRRSYEPHFSRRLVTLPEERAETVAEMVSSQAEDEYCRKN